MTATNKPFILRRSWDDGLVPVQCPCGAVVGVDIWNDGDESECYECHRRYYGSVEYQPLITCEPGSMDFLDTEPSEWEIKLREAFR